MPEHVHHPAGDHDQQHHDCHIDADHVHYDDNGTAHHYNQHHDHEQQPVTVDQLQQLLNTYRYARNHYGPRSELKQRALEDYSDALRRASAEVYRAHTGVRRLSARAAGSRP